jgi:hypothetical protein
MECLSDILANKTAVISLFGGFLESYYSLSILESLNRTFPGVELLWNGDLKYKSLLDSQGLAEATDLVTQYDLDRFPAPIFIDKNDRAYFNCLNNYLKVKPYYLSGGYVSYRALINQIVSNSTLEWDLRDLPRFRHNMRPKGLDYYYKIHNLHSNSKFALLFIDNSFSIHRKNCLHWDVHQVRAAAAILQQNGISLVVVTDNVNGYSYSQAKVIPFDPMSAIYLMKQADTILSTDIDPLLIGMHISDAKLVSFKHKRAFGLKNNARFLNSDNDIYISREMSVTDVCDYILKRRDDGNSKLDDSNL